MKLRSHLAVPPIALIQIDGMITAPSEVVSSQYGTKAVYSLREVFDQSYAKRAASLATGVPYAAHQIGSPNVFDVDPPRIRPRAARDISVPWIWDLIAAAGQTSVVLNWPAIVEAVGSNVMMVTRPALLSGANVSQKWPLSSRYVSPSTLQPEVVQQRVRAGDVLKDEIDAFAEKVDNSVDDQHVKSLKSAWASALAQAYSLQNILSAVTDKEVSFVAVAVKYRLRRTHTNELVAQRLFDIVIEGVRESLGPEAVVFATSFGPKQGQCVVLDPASNSDVIVEDQDSISMFDVAPTILDALGVEVPEECIGKNIRTSPSNSQPAFEMPEEAQMNTEITRVLDLFETGGVSSLHVQRQAGLRAFLSDCLLRDWEDARAALRFKECARIAELMVSFEPNTTSLWRRAFACERSHNFEAMAEASNRLLEEFPGSPNALLSGLLGRDEVGLDEAQTIVNAIDPSSLDLSSLRSTWGRAAIRVGLQEQGLESLERVIADGKSLIADRMIAARAARSLGDPEKALKLLGGIGSAKGGLVIGRLLRAQLLLANGRSSDACRIAEEVMEQYPHDKRAQAIIDQAKM